MPRFQTGLLAKLPLRHVLRPLPRFVEQPGRQLDEPAAGRVPVLPQAQGSVLLVESEDDHRAGVLEDEPLERLAVGIVRSPDRVRPQRHDPVVAVQVGGGLDGPDLVPVGQFGCRHGTDATGAGYGAHITAGGGTT